jgi:peptide/nickel transport system substrate-binding protein
MAFNFNIVHRDPGKRRLFADRRFRIALSHALDRERIIRDILVQPGDSPEQRPEKSQVAPKRESVFFHTRLATQYLDYDPPLANRLLDEAGHSRRGSDGIRLTTDGAPLDFELLVRADRHHHIEAADVAVENWRAVGVSARVKVMDRQQIKDISLRNEHDAIVSYPGGGGLDVLVEPGVYLPTLQGDAFYAVPWGLWHAKSTDPRYAAPEEPPAEVRDMFGIYDQILRTTDRGQRLRLLERLLDRNADQFFLIGVATATSQKGILRHAMRNVPEIMPQSWAYPTPAPTNPSLYFLAE